jgi:hypothetical protein
MSERPARTRLSVKFLAVLALVLVAGCAGYRNSSADSFEPTFNRAVHAYGFNFSGWEASSFRYLVHQKTDPVSLSQEDNIQLVLRFMQSLSELEQVNSQLDHARAARKSPDTGLESRASELRTQLDIAKPPIQSILSRQISLTLARNGIYSPLTNSWLKITFPPVSFRLQPALNILMVSPRDHISRLEQAIIRPEITGSQIDKLESDLEKHNVSALVIPLGGLGAVYPSFVIETSDLKFLLNVVTEEWLHQFMAFRPLGFRLVLDLTGVLPDPDISTLNETLVGIAADEIGEQVYQQFYAAYFPDKVPVGTHPADSVFDFNGAIRTIRLQVDADLAAGRILEAENYMEEQRRVLVSHGYNLRRLNQAYFAFYGNYAYSGTSVDPLGAQARQLRQNSPSLLAYLMTASGFTSRQDLQSSLSGRH